jgi:hypothetical protein
MDNLVVLIIISFLMIGSIVYLKSKEKSDKKDTKKKDSE